MDVNKMTAVEWLEEKRKWSVITNEDIAQAKIIEKHQIMKAVDAGFDDGSNFIEDIKFTNAEQYYNETYNK